MATKSKAIEADYSAELAAMMELLSPEERANLAALTGQRPASGPKTPVIKINYKEKADIKGNKVPKGNFVVGQSSKVIDGKKVLEYAGTDLGDTLSGVILKVCTQYSYWSEDIKKRCSSQILCMPKEVPKGYNLKNVCNDKSCFRRKDGVDKADRCINQYVVFVRLPAGTKLPDGNDCPVAIIYIKGTNYKPFQEYVQDKLKDTPTFAVITKFSTEEEEQGATIYYKLNLEKGDLVPAAIFKENFQLVSGVNTQLLEYKEEQQKKLEAADNKKDDEPVIIVDDDNTTGDDDLVW